MSKPKDKYLLLAIFLAVLVTHSLSETVTLSDPRCALNVAYSIVREGNTNLDEYRELDSRIVGHYSVQEIGGHIYSKFPIAVPVLVVPFVWVADLMPFYDFRADLLGPSAAGRFQALLASFFVALAAVFVYLMTVRQTGNWIHGVVATFVFAFCTTTWSTASRGLWQHGPSMLMTSIALYLFLQAKDRPHLVQYAAIPLALAYAIRPTNALVIVCLTPVVFLRFRRYFLRFAILGLVTGLPFVIQTWTLYGSPFSSHYSPERVGNANALRSFAGVFISPNRGLFIFSPVLLFCLLGLYRKLKARETTILDYCVASVILLHSLLLSLLPFWWGGGSYGPRLMTDVLPFMLFFLAPCLAWIGGIRTVTRDVLVGMFSVLLAVSFVVHFRGAMNETVYQWNRRLQNPRESEQMIWEWSDLQIFFDLTADSSTEIPDVLPETRRVPKDPLELPRTPNIMIFQIGGLRYDALGCFGYKRPVSRNIDALAKRGVCFDNFYTHSAWTRPSVGSLFGFQDPAKLSSSAGQDIGLASTVTLATCLDYLDYGRQAYVTTSLLNDRDSLMSEGFNWYIVMDSDYVQAMHSRRRIDSPQGTASDVNASLIPWLRKHSDGRVFIYVYYADATLPFQSTPDLIKRFTARDKSTYEATPDQLRALAEKKASGDPTVQGHLQHIRSLYDASVAYIDREIGKVVNVLEETGRLENTLILVLSDHGQGFLEHGSWGRNHGLYEEEIHIPLIMAGPGIPEGMRSDSLVSMVDVMPSILEYTGIAKTAGLVGESFMPILRDPEHEIRSYIYTSDVASDNPLTKEAFVTRGRTVIHDVGSDSLELRDEQ